MKIVTEYLTDDDKNENRLSEASAIYIEGRDGKRYELPETVKDLPYLWKMGETVPVKEPCILVPVKFVVK